MPIWLRKFTFNQIQEFYTKEMEKSKSKNKDSEFKTLQPDIKPSYSTKASKK